VLESCHITQSGKFKVLLLENTNYGSNVSYKVLYELMRFGIGLLGSPLDALSDA